MIDATTRQNISEALASWDRKTAAKRVADANALREEFVNLFPLDAWQTLPLTDYALGQENQNNVSRWVEFKTKSVASMSGGSALKHLIFRRSDGVWRYPKEYSTPDEAWQSIRAGFVEMLNLAARGQFDETDDVPVLTGASAVRVKMLYLYFPDDLVAVTSKSPIDHFLRLLGHSDIAPTAVRANRQLLTALREIPELDDLSTQELGYFIYHWADPRTSARIVKIAPGPQAVYWDDCLANDYICVGWDDVGDLMQFEDKAAYVEAFREHYPYNGVQGQITRKSNELWTMRELQPGDQVIANRGISEVLAIGTVNDEGYKWRADRDEYKHAVGVDWDTSARRTIAPVGAWGTTTVSKVSGTLYRQLLGTAPPPKTTEPERIYRDVESALLRRGQAVLYGPPGTGKTFTARRAAVWVLDGGSSNPKASEIFSDENTFAERENALSSIAASGTINDAPIPRLTRITFHPSYAYEDFIEGFRPRHSDNDTLDLVLTDGAFKRVCDAARLDPNNTYVVLIDEINRGNIPKIFGELITLIEKDKRGLTAHLPQSSTDFSVPPNVFILGTMNTADRSIHLLDTALRRRFTFLELLPNKDLLEGKTAGPLALDVFLDGLNERVRKEFGREKQIGHALFFSGGEIIETPGDFAAMFRFELLPLLQEYLYDDYQKLAQLLGKVIDVSTERIADDIVDDPDALCAELANAFGASASA